MNLNTRSRIRLLSLATGLLDAAKMFTAPIRIFYLASLGTQRSTVLSIYSASAFASGCVDFLPSLYAEVKSRSKIIILGFICLTFSEAGYWIAPALKSHYPLSLFYGLVCFDLAATLGRQFLSGKLEGWALSLLPPEEREMGYHDYVIKTQRYASLLALLSSSLGVFLAYQASYSLCYGCSLIFYLCSISLFGYLLHDARGIDHFKEPQTVSETDFTVHQKSTWKKMSENARLIVEDTFFTKVGLTALFGTLCVGLIRMIAYHQWQIGLFGKALFLDKSEASLSQSSAIMLALYNLTSFAAHGLFNEWIGAKHVGQMSYYRRGEALLALGSMGALGLSIGLGAKHPLLSLLLFAALQGATGTVISLHRSLYAACTRQRLIIGSTSLLHFVSRCFTSKVISPWLKNHATGERMFMLPAIGLLLYILLLDLWRMIRHAQQSPKNHYPREFKQA